MYKKKSRLDIKKQLLAAICMLLISSLMMVTSTYAWFTLSTAPEVKGIQTSVGANGNLEIALLSTAASLDGTGITSNVGDSSAAAGKSALTANITWGNLVDLSHESYGLNMIQLLPAALHNGGAEGFISQNFLAVPTYGADGRVNELTAEGSNAGLYDTSKKSFIVPADKTTGNVFGLRGVGVSTNQTVRDMAYNSALTAASSAAIKFKQAATASLTANGNGLASLGSKQAEGQTTFTAAEVAALWNVIDNILGTKMYTTDAEGKQVWDGTTRNSDGLVHLGAEMVANYAAAAFASSLNNATFTDDADFTAKLEALATDTGAQTAAIALHESIGALKEAVDTLAENAGLAYAALPESDKASYRWDEVSTTVNMLFSNLDIWGKTISELKEMYKNDLESLMALLTENGGNIIANIKGGVFADMATIGGGFSAKSKLYINAQAGEMSTIMNAVGTTPSKNANCAAALTGKQYVPAAGETTTTAASITDTYGYIVDLAFRTNASNSSLLLQTAPQKRVNTSSTGAEDTSIMGGGSSITFTSIQEGFGAEEMLNLMDSIRIVFFEPSTTGNQRILAYAKLDTEAIWEAEGYNEDATSVTVNMYMCKSTTDGTTITWQLDEVETDQTKAVIRPLNANVTTPVSMLIYLDGEHVSNADVASGALSMTGTLNVQFASSAELVPMNYTAGYGNANEPTEPPATESTPTESTPESDPVTPEPSEPEESADPAA